MKLKIFSIISIIILAIIALYLIKNKRYSQDKNAFNRKIISSPLLFIESSELPERYYFAGSSETNIFLSRPGDATNLYKLDTSFKKVDTLKLEYPANFNSKAENIYKYAYNNYIFCTNNYGDILRSNGKSIRKLFQYKKLIFDYSKTLSENSIVVRVRRPNNKSLAKIILLKQTKLIKEFHFPELANGSLANDGLLFYNNQNKRIIYLYYYRGEFISLDTNLNLLFKSKTIDTVQSANIKTKITQYRDIRSGKSTTMLTQATPPKIINSYATTFKNRIYIISKLKADNEKDDAFAKNQVIDVYKLSDGKYIHSFYIPKYMDKRLRQFHITENLLIGLNGKYIVKYKFTE